MRLSEWMEKEGLSGVETAQAVGVSAAALSGYVTGQTMPRLTVAIKIVELTKGEVSFQDLVCEKETELDSL